MNRTKEIGTRKQCYLQYTVLGETVREPYLFNTYMVNKMYNVIIYK